MVMAALPPAWNSFPQFGFDFFFRMESSKCFLTRPGFDLVADLLIEPELLREKRSSRELESPRPVPDLDEVPAEQPCKA